MKNVIPLSNKPKKTPKKTKTKQKQKQTRKSINSIQHSTWYMIEPTHHRDIPPG